MSDYNAAPAPVGVEADKKRPYKAYVVAAVAIAITLVQVIQANSEDGQWTKEDTFVTILAFLGAILAYVTKNPLVQKTTV